MILAGLLRICPALLAQHRTIAFTSGQQAIKISNIVVDGPCSLSEDCDIVSMTLTKPKSFAIRSTLRLPYTRRGDVHRTSEKKKRNSPNRTVRELKGMGAADTRRSSICNHSLEGRTSRHCSFLKRRCLCKWRLLASTSEEALRGQAATVVKIAPNSASHIDCTAPDRLESSLPSHSSLTQRGLSHLGDIDG